MEKINDNSEIEVDEWKKGALQLQQEFYEKLGDRRWDFIKSDERWALESKIAYAMFGEPKEKEKQKNKDAEKGKKDNNDLMDEELKAYYEHGLQSGYTKKRRETIKKICDKIYETVDSKEILIAFLFVIGKSGSDSIIKPFFKVQRYPEGKVYFIDNVCRVYGNWEDYKNKHKISATNVLYPAKGTYSSNEKDEVLVEYAERPASAIATKALAFGDTGVRITTMVAQGVGVASIFFPPIAPVAIVAAWAANGCKLYGAGKKIYQICDRSKTVLRRSLSKGGGLARKGNVSAAAEGQDEGKEDQVLENFLNFGALTMNGIEIANRLAHLVDKQRYNDLTAMDVLQFGTLALYFTNSAISAKITATIIDQVQKDNISNFTSDLNEERVKEGDEVQRNSGGVGTMERKDCIVKGIINVGSIDEFLRVTLMAQNPSGPMALNADRNSLGNGDAHEETDSNFQTHVDMNSSNTNSIPSLPTSPSSLSNGHETILSLAPLIETICIENQKEFIFLANDVKIQMTDLYDYIAGLLERYFPSAEGISTFPLSKVIILINSAESLAQSKGCITKEDYFNFLRFQCIFHKSKLRELEYNYQKEKNRVVKLSGGKFNETEFACKWGIKDVNDMESSFWKMIHDETTRSNVELKDKFEISEKEISAINEDGGLKFKTKYCALNEYYHSFMVDGEELSPTEFFNVIRKTVKDEMSQKIIAEGCKLNTYQNDVALVNVKEFDEVIFLDSLQLLKGNDQK